VIAGAEELTPRGRGVRAFTQERRPGFADCAPSGRIRLDAVACWLQDVAYADVEDAELYQDAVWVVRRTRIRVNRFPRFAERFTLTTFCSGLGRMWAERRTDIRRLDAAEPPDVEAVSLWVHLEPGSWRPSPLSDAEVATYSGAEEPRRITARLQHPAAVPATEAAVQWTFRATECDIAGHVNNAAYWAALEDELLRGPEPGRLDAEIEYRSPAQPGTLGLWRDGPRRWLASSGGELHATILVRDQAATTDGERGPLFDLSITR
jgi:acyl-ACP thioesterase